MQSLGPQCAVRVCPGGRTERGQDQIAAAVELLQQDQVRQDKEAPHPVDAGYGCLGEALVWRIGGVDSVHTFGHGLGRTGAGLARIPYVSA